MVILGIVLLGIALVLFDYIIKGLGGPSHNRPLIFYNKTWRNIILLVCLVLFIGGFVCLWKVNPIFVCLTVGGILLWFLSGFILSKDGARAKMFFSIYKKTKANNNISDEEALREATKIYLQRFSASVTADRIDNIVGSIFDPKQTEELLSDIGITGEEKDDFVSDLNEDRYEPKNVADKVLYWEDCLLGHDGLKDIRKIGRRSDEIDKAYKKVLKRIK